MNNWIEKANKDLNTLIEKMAYRDYKQANYTKTGKKKSKKHIPYGLGDDTMEAKRLYNLIYCKEDVTKEVEEQVKAFLIKYRVLGDSLI